MDFNPFLLILYLRQQTLSFKNRHSSFFLIAIHYFKAQQPLRGMKLQEKEAQKD